jgi:hypothetical protein
MRRSVFVLMLALAAFAGLAPVVEAGCAEQCADGAPDLCCSCCVHFKVDAPESVAAPAPHGCLDASSAPVGVRPSSPDPRDILHVPKTSLA